MRGVHWYSQMCRVAPLMRAVSLLAVALAIAVPSIALARATDSHATVRRCGAVQHTVAVTSQGGVACTKARQVANAWLNGNNSPSGFACHRKQTNAGSGFQGVCVKGNKRVMIIPE
jgi:hypothetical protein